MIEGFSLGNYLLLVDYTGRLFREGKATISHEVAEILAAAGQQRRWLASAAGAAQASRRPVAGPVLRGHAGAAACGCEAVRRAPPGQPGRLPGRLSGIRPAELNQGHIRVLLDSVPVLCEAARTCGFSGVSSDHPGALPRHETEGETQ